MSEFCTCGCYIFTVPGMGRIAVPISEVKRVQNLAGHDNRHNQSSADCDRLKSLCAMQNELIKRIDSENQDLVARNRALERKINNLRAIGMELQNSIEVLQTICEENGIDLDDYEVSFNSRNPKVEKPKMESASDDEDDSIFGIPELDDVLKAAIHRAILDAMNDEVKRRESKEDDGK